MLRRTLRCPARTDTLRKVAAQHIETMKKEKTFKVERVITSAQKSAITVQGRDSEVLNFCANNYLGLSNHPDIAAAAHKAIDERGFGLSSVRFICGTMDIHKRLESEICNYLGTEDTILYPSCFDANGGVFEALLGPEDAVISDTLNHASIIDGVRLCKAERHRYKHLDMQDLEEILRKTQDKRVRLVVTDGVFSMDGDVAPLDKIVALAEKYDANIMIDECHASGVIGEGGRGTPALFGVEGHIDIINGTLGKALGGGSGGFSSGPTELVQVQRNKGRPYLFSNSMPPAIVAGSLKALELLRTSGDLFPRLQQNTQLFRTEMKKLGFEIRGHDACPIVPVMLDGSAAFAEKMLGEGIYVIGFSYPVVPKGQERIRVQLSAAHSTEEVQRCIQAFANVQKSLK